MNRQIDSAALTPARTYLSGDAVRTLREGRGLTQRDLAEMLGVTDKAVSRRETGRGLPDISLVEPLAHTLGVSVAELLSGRARPNANRAVNMARCVFYVCPICGNVVVAAGEGSFSCCGSTLLPQGAEPAGSDVSHAFTVERVEDDWFVSLDHPMTKNHYISFVAYVTTEGVHIKKLYPEQACEARFHIAGSGSIYLYCNQHGLFKAKTPARERLERSRLGVGNEAAKQAGASTSIGRGEQGDRPTSRSAPNKADTSGFRALGFSEKLAR